MYNAIGNRLFISTNYDCSDITEIMKTVDAIYFSKHFNNDISNMKFTDNIKQITFGHCFSQDVSNVKFPKNLEVLEFGHEFGRIHHKCEFENTKLPNSLKELHFGYGFNRSINKLNFPDNLTMAFMVVAFCECFNIFCFAIS